MGQIEKSELMATITVELLFIGLFITIYLTLGFEWFVVVLLLFIQIHVTRK